MTHETAALTPEVVLAEQIGLVNADLTVGASVSKTKPLRAVKRVCSRCMSLHGARFPDLSCHLLWRVRWGLAKCLGWTRMFALKRKIDGIHYWVSGEQLDRYLIQFTFCHNSREIGEGQRVNALLGQIEFRHVTARLTYQDMIHNP